MTEAVSVYLVVNLKDSTKELKQNNNNRNKSTYKNQCMYVCVHTNKQKNNAIAIVTYFEFQIDS